MSTSPKTLPDPFPGNIHPPQCNCRICQILVGRKHAEETTRLWRECAEYEENHGEQEKPCAKP